MRRYFDILYAVYLVHILKGDFSYGVLHIQDISRCIINF